MEEGTLTIKQEKLTLWDRLWSPIITLELRAVLKAKRLLVSFMTTLFLLGGILLIGLYLMAIEPGMAADELGSTLFNIFIIFEYCAICLIFPAFTCTSIIGEKEKKSFELLIVTPLSPWEIIWGKFAAAATNAFLFLIATVPLVTISFLFGGVSPIIILFVYVFLFALSCLVIMYALFASCFHKTIVRSIISTYAMISASMPFGIGILGGFLFSYRHSRWSFLTEPWNFNKIMSFFVIPPFVFLAIFFFFFIYATNLIKPVTGNRSTPFRVYFLLFITGFLGIYLSFYFYTIPRRPWAVQDATIILFIFLFIFLLIGGVSFSLETPIPSEPVFKAALKKNHIVKLFYPGSFSGVIYSLLLGCVFISLTCQGIFFPLPQTDTKLLNIKLMVLGTGAVIWSFLFFACTFASFLSFSIKRAITARAAAILVIAALIIIPAIHYKVTCDTSPYEGHASLLNCYYLSPILFIWSSTCEPFGYSNKLTRQINLHLPMPLHIISIIVYTALGSLLFIYCWKRHTKIRREVVSKLERKDLPLAYSAVDEKNL